MRRALIGGDAKRDGGFAAFDADNTCYYEQDSLRVGALDPDQRCDGAVVTVLARVDRPQDRALQRNLLSAQGAEADGSWFTLGYQPFMAPGHCSWHGAGHVRR